MSDISSETIETVARTVYRWDTDGPDKPDNWPGYLRDAEAFITAYRAYLESKGMYITSGMGKPEVVEQIRNHICRCGEGCIRRDPGSNA